MYNPSETSHWQTEHFVAYILLCVASSDLSIDESEMDEIKIHVEKIVSNVDQIDDVVVEVAKVISNHSSSEREFYIQSNKDKYLKDKEIKAKVMEGIEDIITADLNIEQSELAVYRMLKNTLRG